MSRDELIAKIKKLSGNSNGKREIYKPQFSYNA